MISSSIVIASISVIVVLLISYGYLYLSEKKSYIAGWIYSLMMLLIAYLSRLAIIEVETENIFLIITNYISTLAGYWLVFKATALFFKTKHNILWDAGVVALAVGFSVIKIAGWPTDPILFFSGVYATAIIIRTGLSSIHASKPKSSIRIILGCSFFIWAAATALYPFCRILRIIPAYYAYLFVGVAGLITLITVQAVYYQNIREELELKESNLRKHVVYDKLTGAYNRTYFEEGTKSFFNRYTFPVAVAVGDINGLKLINDTFGHLKGDELLVDSVRILKETVGHQYDIIRWGGDEFIIIMPRTTRCEAEKKLLEIKSNFKSFSEISIPLDISIGLSVINDSSFQINEIIKQAEERMYSNKLNENKHSRRLIINFLEKLLWEKDYQTEEHVQRLNSLVCLFGKHIGLTKREINDLTQVAILHDIGKIGIPASILNKPGSLTPHEWNIMKKHCEIGCRITQSSLELAHISEFILSHHEWWNGNGYPYGLRAEEIPLYSRIISIVDSFDVMTHERPYKQAVCRADALEEIEKCAGTQYDPYLAGVFTGIMRTNPGI